MQKQFSLAQSYAPPKPLTVTSNDRHRHKTVLGEDDNKLLV